MSRFEISMMKKPMGKRPEDLLSVPEVFRELRKRGIKPNRLTRRTVQFYSSPRLRLLSLPTYQNRHTAYYRMKDVDRIVVVLLLRENNWKLADIKKLFEKLSEEEIARIANNVGNLSNIDWLISSVTTPGLAKTDLPSAFNNLVEVFLQECLGRTFERFYNKSGRSGRDFQETIYDARKEIARQEKEFIGNLDHIKGVLTSQGFEDRKNELLKEFRAKLEQPNKDKDIAGWVRSKVKDNILSFVFGLDL